MIIEYVSQCESKSSSIKLSFEVHPHHLVAKLGFIEPAQIVADRDGRVVVCSTDFGAHWHSYHQYKCDLKMDPSWLLGACLQEYEYKHANALEPKYFRCCGSGRMVEVANRCAIVMLRVPPPRFQGLEHLLLYSNLQTILGSKWVYYFIQLIIISLRQTDHTNSSLPSLQILSINLALCPQQAGSKMLKRFLVGHFPLYRATFLPATRCLISCLPAANYPSQWLTLSQVISQLRAPTTLLSVPYSSTSTTDIFQITYKVIIQVKHIFIPVQQYWNAELAYPNNLIALIQFYIFAQLKFESIITSTNYGKWLLRFMGARLEILGLQRARFTTLYENIAILDDVVKLTHFDEQCHVTVKLDY